MAKINCWGESKTAAEWSRDPRVQASADRVRKRVKSGWSVEAALTTPPGKKRGVYAVTPPEDSPVEGARRRTKTVFLKGSGKDIVVGSPTHRGLRDYEQDGWCVDSLNTTEGGYLAVLSRSDEEPQLPTPEAWGKVKETMWPVEEDALTTLNLWAQVWDRRGVARREGASLKVVRNSISIRRGSNES